MLSYKKWSFIEAWSSVVILGVIILDHIVLSCFPKINCVRLTSYLITRLVLSFAFLAKPIWIFIGGLIFVQVNFNICQAFLRVFGEVFFTIYILLLLFLIMRIISLVGYCCNREEKDKVNSKKSQQKPSNVMESASNSRDSHKEKWWCWLYLFKYINDDMMSHYNILQINYNLNHIMKWVKALVVVVFVASI